MGNTRKARTLFPMQSSVLSFRVGDHVKKLSPSNVNDNNIVGVVSHILPKTYKLNVQWPYGNVQEAPEDVYKVSPQQHPATVAYDSSYSSWENTQSERAFGSLPKRPAMEHRLASKVAHRHLDKVSTLAAEIEAHKYAKHSALQAYVSLSSKYAAEIGDSLLRELVSNIYGE
jgi:hypothetical protein